MVKAVGKNGNVSNASNELKVKTLGDQALLTLEATDIQTDRVTLKWSPSNNVSENNDLWHFIYVNGSRQFGMKETEYTFNDLQENTEYRFRVQVESGDGNDDSVLDISNEIKVKTLEDQELLTLEATDIQTDSVTLQWSPYDFDENQEPKYNVYCDGTIRKGAFEPVTTIERLQPNTEYAFKVSAADDNWDDLQFSNEIKVKTK
ncbi:fibronectin type III domain-containing protein [Paenibacillus larvae]